MTKNIALWMIKKLSGKRKKNPMDPTNSTWNKQMVYLCNIISAVFFYFIVLLIKFVHEKNSLV